MLLHKSIIIEKETIENSGLQLNPKGKSQVGIIKEIGIEILNDEELNVINIGDRIVYYENSEIEIEFDGKKEIVIEYDDIIKVL